MDSQQEEHASIYPASAMLREILYFFLLFHEVMTDPRLKKHHEVIFLLETLLAQYEWV